LVVILGRPFSRCTVFGAGGEGKDDEEENARDVAHVRTLAQPCEVTGSQKIVRLEKT